MAWTNFPHYWPFLLLVDSQHKGPVMQFWWYVLIFLTSIWMASEMRHLNAHIVSLKCFLHTAVWTKWNRDHIYIYIYIHICVGLYIDCTWRDFSSAYMLMKNPSRYNLGHWYQFNKQGLFPIIIGFYEYLILFQIKLEQLECLRSEDTPCRLMITNTIESYWIPSQNENIKK